MVNDSRSATLAGDVMTRWMPIVLLLLTACRAGFERPEVIDPDPTNDAATDAPPGAIDAPPGAIDAPPGAIDAAVDAPPVSCVLGPCDDDDNCTMGDFCAGDPPVCRGYNTCPMECSTNCAGGCAVDSCCIETCSGDCPTCPPGCSCEQTCTSKSCDANCAPGAICYFDANADQESSLMTCTDATCYMDCTTGVDSNRCDLDCMGTSTCFLECDADDNHTCAINCADTARCHIRCLGPERCQINCSSPPVDCGNDVIVCNQPCPP